jgi:chromosome segregation ATPase
MTDEQTNEELISEEPEMPELSAEEAGFVSETADALMAAPADQRRAAIEASLTFHARSRKGAVEGLLARAEEAENKRDELSGQLATAQANGASTTDAELLAERDELQQTIASMSNDLGEKVNEAYRLRTERYEHLARIAGLEREVRRLQEARDERASTFGRVDSIPSVVG